MPSERFQSNPYPGLSLSTSDREHLLQLANGFVEENFHKYEQYVVEEQRKVDDSRWKHVKSREDLHIYVDRMSIGQPYLVRPASADPTVDAPRKLSRVGHTVTMKNAKGKDMPVVLSVGTFVGQMDDLMFGVVNPTLDVMRIKASYVHDLSDAAVLATVVEPTVEDPFRSVIIKWMQLDLPLSSTSLVKNRDYIYIEATGILHFANGDHVGYHLLHSIDFPQTPPLPKRVRAKLSICGFFRQIDANMIDNYSGGTMDPGGELLNFLLLPAAADALLSATNYVYCGQVKKISWILQKRQAQSRANPRARHTDVCVTCARKTSRGSIGDFGKDVCRMCFGCVCRPCRVRKRISFITPDNRLVQRKITFCAMCVSETTKMNAQAAARDQADGYGAYNVFDTWSHSETVSELSYSDHM